MSFSAFDAADAVAAAVTVTVAVVLPHSVSGRQSCPMMSQEFTILADSNVKRFVTMTNRRACPELDQAQIVMCGKMPMLETCLSEVRSQATIVIIACLTNFLTQAPGTASAPVGVEPILLKIFGSLKTSCSDNPDRFYLVCPPMYRTFPLWYRDGLPEDLGKFSAVFADHPPNLLLMPSFPTPQFESDGVHLLPAAGLEYLFHLFDSAKEVIRRDGLDPETRIGVSSESTRVLEDRMMVLE